MERQKQIAHKKRESMTQRERMNFMRLSFAELAI